MVVEEVDLETGEGEVVASPIEGDEAASENEVVGAVVLMTEVEEEAVVDSAIEEDEVDSVTEEDEVVLVVAAVVVDLDVAEVAEEAVVGAAEVEVAEVVPKCMLSLTDIPEFSLAGGKMKLFARRICHLEFLYMEKRK